MQMGVFQTTLAGVLDAGEGRREPAALYLYLKGMRHAEATTFRGFMFLESADHEGYNGGGTGRCMPRIALDWLPRVFFRRARPHSCAHGWAPLRRACNCMHTSGFSPETLAACADTACPPHLAAGSQQKCFMWGAPQTTGGRQNEEGHWRYAC